VGGVTFPNLGGQSCHKMVSKLRDMSKKWRFPACWWMGMLQNGIRAKRDVQEVVFPILLVVGDVTVLSPIFSKWKGE
jgi:hypothetical protein